MIRLALDKDINLINNIGSDFLNNFINVYKVSNYLKNDKYIVVVNEDQFINAFMIVLKNFDCYELELIVVDRNSRNVGIASRMLDYFFNNYLKKGDEFLLEVAVNNQEALKLYNKYDFNIIGIRKKYYNGIDAYMMKKVI